MKIMKRRLDWLSLVFLVLLFASLHVGGKIWPGETREQLDQRQQQEYHAVGEAEKECEAELGAPLGEDFDDCVSYRMRVYHREQKRLKEANKEIEQYRKQHPKYVAVEKKCGAQHTSDVEKYNACINQGIEESKEK
jgi:hypothetical protein